MVAAQAVSAHAGWSARLGLGFRVSGNRTVLAERSRSGPLVVQRPFYPEGDVCHVYLLHPPGGVVGGDLLQIKANLHQGAKALITTPGATKFYRSAGCQARQVQHLNVQSGACLEWMPQENIYFPGAQVGMQTRIDLAPDARLAYWESHCLGRPVIDEPFDEGMLDAGLEIYRDEQPLMLERLRVHPENRQYSALLDGHAVTATAIFSQCDETALAVARAHLQRSSARVAASLIEDLLVLRYLGESTEIARNLFTQVWTDLRQPLMGRHVSKPRIWNT